VAIQERVVGAVAVNCRAAKVERRLGILRHRVHFPVSVEVNGEPVGLIHRRIHVVCHRVHEHHRSGRIPNARDVQWRRPVAIIERAAERVAIGAKVRPDPAVPRA